MTPLYVALEGPHGAAKTTMAKELADALTRAGIRADSFHHDAPDPVLHRTPWQRALHFALQRAEEVASNTELVHLPTAPRVIVCDRWTLSTWVDLSAAQDGELRKALQQLCHAEDTALPWARYVILDAPREVLHERIRARGEALDADAIDALADRYRRFARGTGAPIVDTSRPRAEVLARLVEIVRGWL